MKKIVLLVILTCLVSIGGFSQTPTLTQPMPVDPQITMGKFPNGLSYYIRANKKPEKRAELRLVVKAGAILEDDDQRMVRRPQGVEERREHPVAVAVGQGSADVIAEAHLDADSIFAGVQRFAQSRAKRLSQQRALLDKLG